LKAALRLCEKREPAVLLTEKLIQIRSDAAAQRTMKRHTMLIALVFIVGFPGAQHFPKLVLKRRSRRRNLFFEKIPAASPRFVLLFEDMSRNVCIFVVDVSEKPIALRRIWLTNSSDCLHTVYGK
jgi:hypothetical protein